MVKKSQNLECVLPPLPLPVDQLALLEASVSDWPQQWWPLLDIQLTTRVTVHNDGADLASNPSGSFSVEVHFSEDDVLDVGDSAVTALYGGSAYRFTESLVGGAVVTTPELTGEWHSLEQLLCISKGRRS